MYIDPELPHEVLKSANSAHDAEEHSICMWQRANYKGGFNYPREPRRKMTPEQQAAYRLGLERLNSSGFTRGKF